MIDKTTEPTGQIDLNTELPLRTVDEINDSLDRADGFVREEQCPWSSDVVELTAPMGHDGPTLRETEKWIERRATMKWVTLLSVLLIMLLVNGNNRSIRVKKAVPMPRVDSPFSSEVTAVFVEPGEEVFGGQLLMVLDSQGLELERIDLTRQTVELEAAYDAAVLEGEKVRMREISREMRRVDEALAEILKRMEETLICAEFNSVISSDFRPASLVGRKVSKGETLVKMMPSS